MGWVLNLPELSAQLPRENQLPQEIRAILAKSDNDTVKINLLLDSANQVQHKDPVKAVTICFYALQLAREAPSESHIDQALLKIGKFLSQNGVYEEAMSYYQEYYERALTSGNIINQLKVRHNIISLKLLVNDKYNKSIHEEMQSLLKEYEAYWERSGDSSIVKEMIPSLLTNLSHLLSLKGDLNEANTFLQRGFEWNAQYKITEAGVLKLYLADFMLKSKMGKFQEAFDQASHAREICLQSGNLLMLASLEYLMGNAYMEKGDQKAAVQSYLNALTQAEKLDNRSIQAQSATKLFEIYQSNGNFTEALQYNQIAERVRETMQHDEAISRIAKSEMLERIHALEQDVKAYQRERTLRLVIISCLFLAMVLLGYFFWYRLRKKYKKVKLEKAVYAVEALKSVEEKEALANALEVKDKQLATETMYRVQKNEIIREVVQKLNTVQRQQKKDAIKELSDVIKGLERALDTNSWEDFELRFLQVHQGFYEKLQEVHPKLTNNERRMCAFLKLGMNSKEISALTGQSVGSLEMARHRLRKKLGLPEQETSLVEFFANL